MEKGNRFQLPESVKFESDQFDLLKQYLLENTYSKILVLTDENTKQYCLPLLEEKLKQMNCDFSVLTVPPGERSKQIEVCISLWKSITVEQTDRKSLLINLGGGMVTDLGGFVASTYKRGIDFLNMPTSLLAMVDASVGGKCGIDFIGYKNQLGVFNEPTLCLIYPKFLETLPKEELLSGYAEVLKHAIIGGLDIHQLERFSAIPSLADIQRSISIKSSIVVKDPFELKERKQLNFGHTIGHAIESHYLTKEEPIAHGIAVAAGMFCEIHLSQLKGLLSESENNVLQNFISNSFPKINFTEKELLSIMEYMHHDKKNEKGVLLFSLLKNVGNCVVNQPVEEELVKIALRHYIAYQ